MNQLSDNKDQSYDHQYKEILPEKYPERVNFFDGSLKNKNNTFISTLTSAEIKAMKGGQLNGLVSINTQNDFNGGSQYDTEGLQVNTEHADQNAKAAG